MARTYRKRACAVCGKEISIAGCAWSSHMRMHVEDGEADEIQWHIVARWREEDHSLSTEKVDIDYEYRVGSGKTIKRHRHVQPVDRHGHA